MSRLRNDATAQHRRQANRRCSGWARRAARTGLIAVLAVVGSAATAAAQETAEYFRANCMSCHTIGGGRLTGPDLKGVEARKDRAWLGSFIVNPKARIDTGDPYAVRLMQEARGVVMPTVPGMNPARAAALLDLIAAESKLERSQFAGLEISDKPFAPEEVVLGRRLFLGLVSLAEGGPACVACHTVGGLAWMGGGRLGPDLTRVYERLGGRRGLAIWLSAPATTTMQPLFRRQAMRPAEVLAITAYLEDAAKQGRGADSVALLNFFLVGLGGAVATLAVFGVLWKRRFRAVRRPLVLGADTRGEG